MIRTPTPQDASALWEIFIESLGYACTEDVIRRQIDALAGSGHCISLVWQDDESGRVGAFIHALRYDTLHNAGGWDVVSLAVAPDLQGQGIGKQLLEALEARVRAGAGTFVRLNSRVERTDAHGFYEHLGYTCDKLQKRFIKRLDDLGGGDAA